MKTYKFESNDLNGYSNIISRVGAIADYDLELDREGGALPIDPIHEDDETCGEAAMDEWAKANGYVKLETVNFDNTNADAVFYLTPEQFSRAINNNSDFTPYEVETA